MPYEGMLQKTQHIFLINNDIQSLVSYDNRLCQYLS